MAIDDIKKPLTLAVNSTFAIAEELTERESGKGLDPETLKEMKKLQNESAKRKPREDDFSESEAPVVSLPRGSLKKRKAESNCFDCDQRGHWSGDRRCPLFFRQSNQQQQSFSQFMPQFPLPSSAP